MRRPYERESVRWLTHARDEFEDANELRQRDRFYLALFHFQQAAEKALKAYLYLELKSGEVFYTHSIDELIQMAVEIDPEFEKIVSAKKLDQYYIPTRYPNGLPGGVPSRYYDDPEEAMQAKDLAEGVIKLVIMKINRDNRDS
ncbi:MAG: HEPN domain-containing protein [Firmicutes bacterium]|jgi:HEPN domain-containing protein|nr:HEPN domain-containing protein [Bacillota bacterium]